MQERNYMNKWVPIKIYPNLNDAGTAPPQKIPFKNFTSQIRSRNDAGTEKRRQFLLGKSHPNLSQVRSRNDAGTLQPSKNLSAA
jgi:hypothetical protein